MYQRKVKAWCGSHKVSCNISMRALLVDSEKFNEVQLPKSVYKIYCRYNADHMRNTRKLIKKRVPFTYPRGSVSIPSWIVVECVWSPWQRSKNWRWRSLYMQRVDFPFPPITYSENFSYGTLNRISPRVVRHSSLCVVLTRMLLSLFTKLTLVTDLSRSSMLRISFPFLTSQSLTMLLVAPTRTKTRHNTIHSVIQSINWLTI